MPVNTDADAYYGRVARWSASGRYRRELAALLAELDAPPGARLLDVGCGTGAGLAAAAGRGLAPVGLDRPPGWPRACAARPVTRGDAASLPFAAGTFDVALLFHVLAHLDRPARALAEIARVLRPGGRLALSTPNASFLAALHAGPGDRNGYVPDPTVVRHLTERQVNERLVAAGFRVRYAATFDPGDPGEIDGGGPAVRAPGLPGERLLFVAETDP